MTGTVAQLENALEPNQLASAISNMYTTYKDGRSTWEEETAEVRDYIFATDTVTTSNSTLAWSNKTHVPKITQIYDNLKANYMSALFPHDDWLTWEAGSSDAAEQGKRKAVLGYMKNKLREGNFYTICSALIDDYIMMGNAIADVEFIKESKVDETTGETIAGFVGPRVVRTSPYDIAFNPLSQNFKDTPIIRRTVWTYSEFKRYVNERPEDQKWLEEGITKLEERRNLGQAYSARDFQRAKAMQMDGFGSMHKYLNSGTIEVIELIGDIYDPVSDTFLKDRIVTIADRSVVLRNEQNPSWLGRSSTHHVGWRERPDNLWAMSPLANIVGLQYRINHLENSKADAIDLNIFPPIKVKGEVEDYEWAPGAEIQVDENGDVELLSPDLTALAVDQEIQFLMDQMELFTGAPREAMGVRTPGEKTAFEVQSLVTAASRIFQEKIRNFEINLLEPLLNSMLEVARRNVDGSDTIRVLEDAEGIEAFLTVTKEDISAAGKLRPIGARHFARQAQLVQNLIGLSQTPIWNMIQPHMSRTATAKLAEQILGLEKFDLFGDNKGLLEDAESAQLAQELQNQLAQGDEQGEQRVEEEPVGPAG